MTDLAHAAAPRTRDMVGPRREAFRAAGRHTARVRLLRRLVLFGAVGGSALIVVFAFFNPFRVAIPGVSIGAVGIDGGRVTMEHPRLTGFRADGRPYELLAARAIQDVKTPSVLALEQIDAHVTMADKSVVHILSDSGLYDSSKETMQLTSAVHLTSDNGLDAHLKSAFIAFKAGTVDTRDALTVVMSTGTVSADGMHMSDNGALVTFEGHVDTIMMPASTAARTAETLKAGTP